MIIIKVLSRSWKQTPAMHPTKRTLKIIFVGVKPCIASNAQLINTITGLDDTYTLLIEACQALYQLNNWLLDKRAATTYNAPYQMLANKLGWNMPSFISNALSNKHFSKQYVISNVQCIKSFVCFMQRDLSNDLFPACHVYYPYLMHIKLLDDSCKAPDWMHNSKSGLIFHAKQAFKWTINSFRWYPICHKTYSSSVIFPITGFEGFNVKFKLLRSKQNVRSWRIGFVNNCPCVLSVLTTQRTAGRCL